MLIQECSYRNGREKREVCNLTKQVKPKLPAENADI